jgi:peroxiredoxin family protein
MSMDLMGFSQEELIDYRGLKPAGVAEFLQEAGTSKTTLFI